MDGCEGKGRGVFPWERREHPWASPNNDGLESAFVYTSSRMNAIQKTINISVSVLRFGGTELCCLVLLVYQVEASHLYRDAA